MNICLVFTSLLMSTLAKYGLQTGAGKFMLTALGRMLDMNDEHYTICILLIFCVF